MTEAAERLVQMTDGYRVTLLILIAVELRVCDVLAGGPAAAATVAPR